MKRGILFFLILVYATSSFAQQKEPVNILSAGINGAFYGSGDMTGICLVTEYSYILSKHFALNPGVRVGVANNLGDNSFDHLSSLAVNASLSVTPFPKLFDNLKIEIGGLYHHLAKSYGNFIDPTPYGTYMFSSTEYWSEDLWGLLGSVRVNIFDGRNALLGLRADMLTSFDKGYLNCDGLQFGIYFGLKH